MEKTIIEQLEEHHKKLDIPPGYIHGVKKQAWDGKLTENWRICDGAEIKDKDSPFYSMNILDYEDENFIYLIKIK